MSNRNLKSLALALMLSALPVSFAQAADPTLGDVIAAQGNRALQEIRTEVLRALPRQLKALIALPARGNADAEDAAVHAGHLLYVDAVQRASLASPNDA